MSRVSFTIEGPLRSEKSCAVCDRILRALPDWFGIEEAIVSYSREVAALPTWVAYAGSDLAGFLAVRQHFPCSAELYVMGVLPAFQRSGIGRALVSRAEAWLREQGVEYFQVKTLAPTHPDPFYARTRAFYAAAGFRPLEILPQVWNEENPCMVMVKRV